MYNLDNLHQFRINFKHSDLLHGFVLEDFPQCGAFAAAAD
jgi:hypothetical protein